jgi:hypothetical protein
LPVMPWSGRDHTCTVIEMGLLSVLARGSQMEKSPDAVHDPIWRVCTDGIAGVAADAAVVPARDSRAAAPVPSIAILFRALIFFPPLEMVVVTV